MLAVEPVREFREAGQALHTSARIEWRDDRLPDLAGSPAHETFDLVILRAVWQHLDNAHRAIAMSRLSTITAANGLLIMSIRHGPGAVGRPVFPVSPETTIDLARAYGFRLLRRKDADSVQPANQVMNVAWTWLAFETVAQRNETRRD